MLHLITSLGLAFVTKSRTGGIIINEHVLSASQTRFHLAVLGRWFDFIGLQGLARRLATPSRRPFCLLTFDDGRRSNFTQAAPELRRKRVPGVFYLTTDFIDGTRALWFDRQRALVRRLGYCPPGLELHQLKQLPYDALTARLDRAGAPKTPETEANPDDVQPMSWDEARLLSRQGFTIGAHGVTHTILTRECKARALAEIDQSLAKVSTEIGATCFTFAFPNGNYDEALAKHVVESGAETAMTTDPAWVDAQFPAWRLPRVQLFGQFSRARIELKLALAAIRGALPNPNGSRRMSVAGSRSSRFGASSSCSTPMTGNQTRGVEVA